MLVLSAYSSKRRSRGFGVLPLPYKSDTPTLILDTLQPWRITRCAAVLRARSRSVEMFPSSRVLRLWAVRE
jgi:hypothetical protein